MSWLDPLRSAFRPQVQVGAQVPEGLSMQLSRDSLGEVRTLLDSATSSIDGELFRLAEPGIQAGIDTAAARGVAQRYLVDPEGFAGVRGVLPDTAEAAAYAQMPYKNHSKGIVVDESRALMTTGAFVPRTADRVELVARFQGDAALALRELIDAGRSGNAGRLRGAASEAAKHGIVVNEPIAGVQHLTGAVHDLIRRAERDLTISTKIFSDPTLRKAVADANERGVRVRFTDIRAKDMHANLLVADDSLYIGTAHFSPRGMGDMRLAYRKSRESGLVVHDAGQAQAMRRQLDEFGMQAYKPKEFEQTRRQYARIDAYRKAVAEKAPAERLAAVEGDYNDAIARWHEITAEVAARRTADGITFTNPAGRPAIPASGPRHRA